MRLLDLLEASPTDNPAFQRWFAGSKVVDAHGNPLRVYHGTTGDIEAFNDVAEGIDGIYFTAAPSIANQYADWRQGEGEEATVYATYLALKNPLVVDYMAYLKQNNDGEFADERDARGEFASEMVEEIVQTAKDFKRDGVILYNIRDGWTDNSELSTTYIAFYPNQIKSVFNRGTWDRSPKISESMGGTAFQAWFRNSKIVDRQGNPLPVHHGSAIPKTEFRASRSANMHGIYFTPDLDLAQDFADIDVDDDEAVPHVYSVYLSIQNPLIVRDGIVDDPRVTLDNLGRFVQGMGQMDYQQLTTEMRDILVQDGYDGIVITDGAVEDASEIVAFNPHQVKSIENKGTWNPGSPLISESAGIPPELEPDWGVKIGKNARFFRGESETSGSNGASYGAGLYTTTSRKFASNYGKVRELSRWDALPDNPIRFRTNWDWEMWLQRYDQYHGILGARDRGQKHHDIGDYIRLVFPTADGAQIGTGNDAIFVKWPISETERGQ